MTIRDIYERFSITPNLQNHMIVVTDVALNIYDNGNFENVDRTDIQRVGLLHDLGNIVKFDLNKYPDYLGKEAKRLAYWLDKQKKVIEKYGTDDHKATKLMLKELQVDERLIEIILNKSFANALEIESSDDLLLKILFYADMRVSPKGLVSMEERLTEIMNRLEKYKGRKDLLEAAFRIERQIESLMNKPVEEIEVGDLAVLKNKYLSLSI